MNKITLPFLPMEDIVGELTEKYNITNIDKVNDAIKDNIGNFAIVPDPTDRTTVENSLKLNGKPAEDYILRKEGEDLLVTLDSANNLYTHEITNVRDELYRLKSDLAKNGYTDQQQLYEGFHDGFNRNFIKYDDVICGITEDILSLSNTLTIDDLSKLHEFEVGKYFAIVKDTDEFDIVMVTAATSTGVITFTPSSALLSNKDVVKLYGSKGQYIRNSFSFSRTDNGISAGSKIRYHMQNDDTSTTLKAITKPNTGYAAYFKVPANVTTDGVAALTEFTITCKAVGNPGDLICYVLNEEAIMSNGVYSPKIKDIEDAKNKGYLIAQSQPLHSASCLTERQQTFNFFDGAEYPMIEPKRYIFVIESVNANDTNYWEIRFSFYMDDINEEDLERYNKSYVYEKIISDGSNDDVYALSDIDTINKYDLMFIMATQEVLPSREIGYSKGLYSTHVILPKDELVNKLRFSTQISREGRYYVESYDNTYTQFILEKEDIDSYSNTDLRFNTGDKIIIGNQYVEVQSCSGNKVITKTPVFIDYRINRLFNNRIPVYRMNYKINIKPYYVDFNTFDIDTNMFISNELASEPINLELIKIVPNGDGKIGSHKSDRLIFEASLDEKKYANEFDIEVVWNSPFTDLEINNINNINNNYNELIGRLYDIVFSTNTTL